MLRQSSLLRHTFAFQETCQEEKKIINYKGKSNTYKHQLLHSDFEHQVSNSQRT